MHLISRVINLGRRINSYGEGLRRARTAFSSVGEGRGDSDGRTYRRAATIGGGEGRQRAAAAGTETDCSVAVGPLIGGGAVSAVSGEGECRDSTVVTVNLVSRIIHLC